MVDNVQVAYELIGDRGRPWVLTPGGRFSKDYPGVREMAEALAADGNRVLIWDRPNCGASDVEFSRESESAMQADVLAGLIRELDLGPTVIAGGSGGSRVSMIAAIRHPDISSGLAAWWISGGVYGLMSLGVYYCGGSLAAAWNGGMEAVLELPEWQEVLERNPRNRDRLLAQDPRQFVDVMERWMAAYCPNDEVVPGLRKEAAAAFERPALIFRSGASDVSHTRATSEQVAAALPTSRLVEPPWGDKEWFDRSSHRARTGEDVLFLSWPKLVPQLTAWAREALT